MTSIAFLKRPQLNVPNNTKLAVMFALLSLWAIVYVTAWFQSDDRQFVVNRSYSLPGWVYLAEKGKPVSKEGLIAFNPRLTPLVKSHFPNRPPLFVKRVLGVAGDIVRRDEQGNVLINNVWVGRTKKRSMRNEILVGGPTGAIPEGCYYAGSSHKDGFDSRYEAIGFICPEQIYGSAKELF